ncbi:hypothetical protein DNAM5_18 [Haloarcula californiae tailed virus 1]|uniref:Uncharacterized protein n=1 Tax=Haloarcula californiae tailed virus 1 TaxID=1273746 RepID=R4THU1_9CAUD|nr:hypothetical protein M202_gp018 [Haloarcula californiae tailed virus 1]AGM11881.1 hypothetical protein DNAM5_18 [Haloarcula californiae tailed virus 1]
MTDYLRGDTVAEVQKEYGHLHEEELLLRLKEDAEEFGGGYTLVLCTNSRTLYPGTVRTLAKNDLGAEYLGTPEDLHEWLLVEE